MASNIVKRVESLRECLRRNGLCAFIFPSTDPHQGEYVPEHWQTRKWISGFDGSAGTAVVTLSDAALWTDSRYFIAAEQQLSGTPFQLMKEGLAETPTITTWLCQQLKEGEVVGMIRAMKAVVHAPAASVKPRFIGEEADDERHDT